MRPNVGHNGYNQHAVEGDDGNRLKHIHAEKRREMIGMSLMCERAREAIS